MTAGGGRGRALAAGCGAHIVQDGLGSALYVLMPVLAQAFGLSYAQVGVVRAVKAAAMTAFELPAGILSERLGERSLLTFGLLGAGLGFLLLAVAPSVEMVVLALFVTGLGAAFQHALSSAVISKSYGDQGRRAALGIYNSAGDAGKLAFSGLLSLALGAGLAWQGVAAGFGALTLLTALAVYAILRGAGLGGPAPVAPPAEAATPRLGWGVRDRPGFAALSVMVFLDTSVQSGFALFVAFMIAEKGVALHLAGFAVVLTLVGGMFGKAGCGWLAQKLGLRAAFAVVQCATALGLVAVAFAPAVPALLMLAPLGVFLQGSTSITYGAVADLVHRDRQSRGFALIYSVSSLSAIIGPVFYGMIGDRAGLQAAMLVMALISLLALAPNLLMRPQPAGSGAL